MTTWVVLITLIAAGIAMMDWRKGVYAVIVVGVLQDPLRKLTPDIPSYYLLWSAAIFGVVVLNALSSTRIRVLPTISLHNPRLQSAWQMFFVVISLHAMHALLRWGSPYLPMLGLMFYLSPIVALLVGYAFAKDERWLRRFLFAYCLIIVPAALTVYLSVDYSDEWDVLKDIGIFIGKEMKIYDVGTVLASHPGIFRVGEIAAWHAATASMFLFILYSTDRSLVKKIFVALLIIALIGAILLTGRRKMLGALTLFIVAQSLILGYFRRGSWRQTILIVILGLAGTAALTSLEPSSQESLYIQRGGSVYQSASGRFETTYELTQSAIFRSAGIGLGVGAGAQGAQHVGGSVKEAGGAGEAGLSKIILELGLPGLLVVLFLAFRLGEGNLRSMRILARVEPRGLYYATSIISFFLANLVTFVVASQVYGDVFVLIVLGMSAGLLFSVHLAGLRRYVSTQGLAARGVIAAQS